MDSDKGKFVGTIKLVVKKYIAKGFQKQFILVWDEICNELFSEFQKIKDKNVADGLINNLNLNGRQ